MSISKLSPQAIYCLSEAINNLHEAARSVDEFSSQDILEIADELEAIKEWGKENEHQQ